LLLRKCRLRDQHCRGCDKQPDPGHEHGFLHDFLFVIGSVGEAGGNGKAGYRQARYRQARD
jgi:hypothetical protein